MNLAIIEAYPLITISYPQTLISREPLPAAENAVVARDAEGNLLFTWVDNTGIDNGES